MKFFILSAFLMTAASGVDFADPVRLKAAGEFVQFDLFDYAAPCWADVTGDGKKDLIVGRIVKGKIRVYPGQEGNKLGKGQWLKAGGQIAEVPGVC